MTGLRILAALALACVTLIVTTGADARQRHKTYAAHPDCNITMPCEGVAPSVRGEAIAKRLGFGAAQKVYTPRVSTTKTTKNIPQIIPERAFYRDSEPRQRMTGLIPAIVAHPSAGAEIAGFGPAIAEKPLRRSYSPSAPGPSFAESISRPVRYITGRLICAVNVNAALAERGIRGTGSALAMSFRHWGRSAGGPVPGAVILSARRGGGHVAIVSRVDHGVVYAWNATGGQRGWREIPYRHHVIDYRIPG